MNNKALRYLLYGLIALAAFGAGTWFSLSGGPKVQGARASDVVYGITLPDLANQTQSLAQWRGQVMVVNFWATWCAPCREEIPVFVGMQQKYAGKGLQFIGIAIDQVDKTREFATNFKINYPSLIGTFDTIEISKTLGNQRRVLPFTVILDRQGRIVATELGGLTETRMEALLKPLL